METRTGVGVAGGGAFKNVAVGSFISGKRIFWKRETGTRRNTDIIRGYSVVFICCRRWFSIERLVWANVCASGQAFCFRWYFSKDSGPFYKPVLAGLQRAAVGYSNGGG